MACVCFGLARRRLDAWSPARRVLILAACALAILWGERALGAPAGVPPATDSAAAGGVAATPEIIVDLLLILAAAAAVGLVGARLRIALIPAYLLTGILIGPQILGLVQAEERIHAISELALILLMFGIGLHLDLSSFRGFLVPMTTVGVVSTLLSTLLLMLGGLALGMNATEALVVGMALSMSSTAVVLKILQSRRELKRMTGRVIFAVLMVQDLAAVIMLAALPPLALLATDAADGGTSITRPDTGQVTSGIWSTLALRGVVALGGIGLMLAFTRYALPRLLAQAAKTRADEVMLILSAAAALGAAVLAAVVGLSPALGAFIAGFMLAATPFRYQISGQLGAIRDLFMAVFFVALGLSVEIGVLKETWWLVIIGLGVLITAKFVAMTAAAWLSGATSSVAGHVALSLAHGGEFSLVLLAAAVPLGLIDSTTSASVVAVIVLSLIATPSMVARGASLGAALPRLPPPPWLNLPILAERGTRRALDQGAPPTHASSEAASTSGETAADAPQIKPRHVVIAGFGPVGRAVAERLQKARVPYIVIEMNPATVRRQATLGRDVVYGDAASVEVLESADVGDAGAVVLTMPDDDAMLRACKAIRTMAPDVFIAARATYLSKANAARTIGADRVVVEEVATAESMERLVLQCLFEHGLTDEAPPHSGSVLSSSRRIAASS